MTKVYNPLRNKSLHDNEIDVYDECNDKIDNDLYFKSDVESAIKGLKQDISEEIIHWRDIFTIDNYTDPASSAYYRGYIQGLRMALALLSIWFE